MKEIVKTCLKHGDLTIDHVNKENIGVSFRLRCKECRKEYSDKNKEKLLEYSRKYEQRRAPRKYEGALAERVRKTSKEWRQKNSDIVNARVAADREKDPEKYRNYDRKWRAKNIERSRLKDIVKKHNISYEEYLEMMKKQNGLCAMCSKPEKRRSRTKGQICRLAVDHNHATGKIRELLCHGCNQVIGHAKESVEILKKAILYLEKHQCN